MKFQLVQETTENASAVKVLEDLRAALVAARMDELVNDVDRLVEFLGKLVLVADGSLPVTHTN